MKMNHKFYIWLIGVVIGISICWQLLELLIYGEVQPRIVDDIIGLFWIGAICFAYKFKEIELKRMWKKCKEVHINNPWWLKKPVSPKTYTGEYDYIWLPSDCESGNKGGFAI